jgi:hypothetical protein
MAQSDTLNGLKINGYAEFYYTYNFAQPDDHLLPEFIYNHNRHNEVNINLAFISAKYKTQNLRTNLSGMIGTYAQSNLSSEPIWAQFIFEANAGIRLSKDNSWWLDVGIMPSHIGFESAIGADCWTLTRSIMAENSPYYETGIKLGYESKNQKWSTSFLVLNGWQRVFRQVGHQSPSFGIQVQYKPSSRWTINYSNFIGKVLTEIVKDGTRIFHNFYTIFTPNDRLSFIAGFDIGRDRYDKKSYGIWYAPIFIGRYTFSERYKMALRSENYTDPHNIIISTINSKYFETMGFSLNLDIHLNTNAVWRNEIKTFLSKYDIFAEGNRFTDSNLNFITVLAVRF